MSVRSIDSLLLQNIMSASGPIHPLVQGVPELLPDVRRSGLEFNLSLLSICKIKNEWNYTSYPLKPQYAIWPDVTEVLHLVITMLVVKILLKYAEKCDTYILGMDGLSPALDETLLSDLKCPVCTQYMVPPILLCTNGHNICSKCRQGVQCCPTCRAECLGTRNKAVENIVRKLKFPCVNRQNGCFDMLSIDHIAEHHAVCVYIKIKCPFHLFETCSWNGLKKDFKRHAKEAHPHYVLEVSSFHSPHLPETLVLLSCFGELFTHYLQKHDGRYYAAVQMMGASSEASKYKCEFTLRAANGIEQISKTLFVQGYSEDFETIFNSGNCFNLDEKTVNNFVEQNELSLYITLYRI